ncbi:MAG: ACT domain-containing protein [Chthoniobacterales bacterium]
MCAFSFLHGVWSVAQLRAEEPIPEWVRIAETFVSITRTRDELSIVCPSSWIPPDVRHEPDWSVIKLHGPFPFTAIGVLASFSAALAAADISIVAISTFDTDYILVKADQALDAQDALIAAGHLCVESA